MKKFQIAVRRWDREREGGVTLSTTRSRNRHIPRTAFPGDFSLLQPPHPAVHAIATGSLTAPEAARNLGGYMGVTGRTKRTFVDNADGLSTAATARIHAGLMQMQAKSAFVQTVPEGTGSQEVASSILASSTNKINNFRTFPPSPHLRFHPTFAVCLPFWYRESTW